MSLVTQTVQMSLVTQTVPNTQIFALKHPQTNCVIASKGNISSG